LLYVDTDLVTYIYLKPYASIRSTYLLS